MNGPRPKLPDVVIRASAGTGKTFQLSNRFLTLALDGAPVDTILATTFTRKAAGEILDRVLTRLAEAALDAKKLAALADQLNRPGLDRAHCLDVLQTMVRQLHRLRVGTLDSVFAQMARSFSLELGLPPGWQICDETTDLRLRVEAIREMLEAESTDDTLRLMHLLSKGEAARGISRQILDLVQDLYRIYLESPAEAWHALPRRKSLDPAELAAAVAALAEVALPSHKSILTSREKDLARIEAQQWEAFLSGGLPKQIVSGETTYYKKEITPDVRAAYLPVVEHATAQILAAIANQTEATHAMLARFDASYNRLRTMQRTLRFDDVTCRLGEAADARPLDQVAYRLDARLEHLLLDEFQDTSPAQWHVLRPFARQIVGRADDTFFCVGDVKQAIYGWRGGVAEILEAIGGELSGLASEELDKSYRSSPVVIDVVNRVFERLADNDAMQNYEPAARAWAERFRPHSTARTELAGYGHLETAPMAGEGEKQTNVTLDHAAARIAELHAAAPGRSIGVLVRRNASVARLIYRLRKTYHIAASEEGGNPLGDSPAVELVLSLLRLADHPGDTASRFHVAQSPLGAALDFTRFDDDAAARRLSAELRRRLLDEGYGPTIYDWTRRLAPSCDARDLSRLVQLIEMAYGYQPRATERADDFIDLVSRQRVEDPTSADVRVMTVHQAKGLQFDIVVLPELDYKLMGQPSRMVVGRAGPTAPVERVCRYVGENLRPLLPREFQAMFEKDRQQSAEEALCLLYVALTRAVHALHVIVAPSKENEKKIPATPAGLLRAALVGGGPLEPKTTAGQWGDADWASKHAPPVEAKATGAKAADAKTYAAKTCAAKKEEAVAVEPLRVKLADAPKQSRRGLDRRSPSQLEGGSRVALASRIGLESTDALVRGTVMHAWFEQIGWINSEMPDDEQLARIARRHTSDEGAVARWLTDFRAALARPAVRAVLTPAAHGAPETRLWRRSEHPFAVREGDAILNGTIDRLVVCYDRDIVGDGDAKPISADVLDFKTDRVADDPAGLDARVEFYRPQMQAYARAVAKMFGLPGDCVTARLVFVEPGVVREA
ncbi:MAG TPA: hypothetical protein DD670_15475 [Planctomycetaceae bacterium]|nr:hypothetical protein [Planctomycetaceae bacterium]